MWERLGVPRRHTSGIAGRPNIPSRPLPGHSFWRASRPRRNSVRSSPECLERLVDLGAELRSRRLGFNASVSLGKFPHERQESLEQSTQAYEKPSGGDARRLRIGGRQPWIKSHADVTPTVDHLYRAIANMSVPLGSRIM